MQNTFHCDRSGTFAQSRQIERRETEGRPLQVTSWRLDLRRAAHLAAALLMLHSQVAVAGDLPTGGSVASGAANIGVNGSTMTINQSTNKAIINWNTFDVGAQNRVVYNQPSKDSSVLNRVTSDATSTIAGQVTANGQVYFVNPNGIFITSTGAVKTGGGFIASTNDITDADYNAGRLKFSGSSSGRVTNAGSIEVGEGGFAALLGNGGVSNEATISVPAGKVALGSGSAMTLDPSGTGFLQILAPSTQGDNAVNAGGRITAEGGRIELKASSADQAVRSIVNVPGEISASSARMQGGAIVLDGGSQGVKVTGRVSAASSVAKGGSVKVAGKNIQLLGANVDVSGATGGGKIGVGGGRQGAADADIPASAQVVHVDEASVLNASATGAGDGGSVILWSTLGTRFAGLITARGGADGGAGGFVETSSLGVLSVPGTVDAAAPKGKAGEWLLDPTDVSIGDTAGSPTSAFSGGTWSPTGPAKAYISAQLISDALAAGTNVTVVTTSSGTQSGSITLENLADIVASNSSATLTLWATGNIFLYRSILLSQQGSVKLRTDTGFVTNEALGLNPNAAKIQAGSLILQVAGSVLLSAGGNVIANVSGTFGSLKLRNHLPITLGSMTATSGDVIVNAYGAADNITLASGAVITSAADIVLSSGGKFINNAGANALVTPNGRWLIYSANPANNTFGGLNSNNSAFWNTSYDFLTPATVTATGNRYLFSYQPKVTFTAGDATKTYGQNITSATASNYTMTGIEYQNGVANAFLGNGSFYSGAPTATSLGAAATAAATAVGSEYSIDVAQGTLTGLNGYGFTFVSGKMTVNKATLTVTADSKSRAYGDANPTLTYTVVGLVNSDTLSGALSTTADASSSAGTSHAITQGTLAASANYTLTYVGANLTVGKRAITVTADAKSRAYGDANPTLTYQITSGSLVNSDTLTGALETQATTASAAGTYAITQGALAASANYTLTYVGANLTVGKRAITVTADAKSRAYGDANPTLTYQITSGSLVNSDTLTGALETQATTASAAGTYAITQGALAASANYTLTYVGANLAVGKRAITVTADAKSRAYGDANPTLTYQITSGSLVNGDTLTGALETQATTASAAGTYAITQGALAASANYALTYVGANLTVGKRAITVTADAKSRAYGDANPTLTYQITSGSLVNSDTLTGALETQATTASAAGTYAITQGALAASANYALTYRSANLTVSARAITVTADAKSRAYGAANPTLTYQITSGSLVNGDTFTGALSTDATTASAAGLYAIRIGTLVLSNNYSVTYVAANLTVGGAALTIRANALSRVYGDANPTLTYTITSGALASGDTLTGALETRATTASAAGTYAITQGTLAAPSNYSITFEPGTLTVSARAITVTADAKSRAYGDANPTLTYQITSGSLVNSDTLTGALETRATTASAAGTYAITQGALAASANYALTYRSADLTVSARAITVTADAKSRAYGDANPALTYQITSGSLVNGDTLSGALETRATTASAAGTYAITQGALAASANYTLTYVGANLTVGKRAITVTADAKSRAYGDANPTLTYQITSGSLVNGDTLSGALETRATTASAAGTYAITQGALAASANYALTYRSADLTVTTRNLAISAIENASKTYGRTYSFTSADYTVSGLVNGDTVTSVTLTSAGAGATANASATPYVIAASDAVGAGLSNYNITYNAGALKVNKAELTITANNAVKTYGNALAFTGAEFTASGLVNNDSVASVTLASTGSAATAHVGAYDITASNAAGDGLANYNIGYRLGALTVNKRAITVKADNQTAMFGGPTPVFTTQVVEGSVVNGDTATGSPTVPTGTQQPGTFDILQGTLTFGENYDMSWRTGSLTVVPPMLAGLLVRDAPLLAPGSAAAGGAMLDPTPTGSIGAAAAGASDTAPSSPTGSAPTKNQCYTTVARAVVVRASATVLDLVPCR